MPQQPQINWSGFEELNWEGFPEEEQQQEQPGLLRRMWDTATTPVNEHLGITRKVTGGLANVPNAILDIKRHAREGGIGRSLEMLKGFGQGALEGVGQFSPLDYLDLATGFGKKPLISGANRLISGLVAGQGAKHISEGEGLTGAAEILGGTVGMLPRGARPRVSATVDNVPTRVDVLPPETPRILGDRSLPPADITQPRQLPAMGESTPAATRFYQGQLGVADATKQYPIDLPGSRNPGGSPLDYPESLGTIDAVTAAERGLGTAHPLKETDPISRHPAFGALIPESMKYAEVPTPIGALPMDIPKTTPTGKPLPQGARLSKRAIREGILPPPTRDIKLEHPSGGRIVDPPVAAKELPYDPNRFDQTATGKGSTRERLLEGTKQQVAQQAAIPPQQKLISVLQDTQPLSRAERKIYGGSHAPIRQKLDQKDINGLFELVRKNDTLTQQEQQLARAGLIKLLDKNATALPRGPEMVMLNRVFGDDLTNLIKSRETLRHKTGNIIQESVNLPRAIMATADYSAPFRQGLPLIHKKAFWTSFDDMFKAGKSDEGYKAVRESIEANPRYASAIDHGLEVTDAYGDLSKREERFMSTWAEKVPGFGRVARGSNRAYTGFLNKLRMDTYDSLMNQAIRADPMINQDLASRQIADFVNTATGRGSLGRFEKAAPVLNATLFSPRLQASRLDLYRRVLDPRAYSEMPKGLRMEALKSLFSVVGLGGTLGAVASEMGPNVNVSTDPTNSDFGKIKIGNTRIDPYGGFQQYAVLANRLLASKTTSPVSGESRDFGPGFADTNPLLLGGRFLRSKAHPAVSFAVDLAAMSDSAGQPFEVKKAIAQRMVPIVLQDLKELHDEDPDLLPLVIPAMFGMGVQSFGQASEEWRK